MVVVDTSAVLAALVARPQATGLVERLSSDADLHAPHLIDVEIIHALRRLVTIRHLTEDRAADARSDYANLLIMRYPHVALADRMWALRDNLTAYDAAFVALSEKLRAPLITCDRALAGSPGHEAEIEVF